MARVTETRTLGLRCDECGADIAGIVYLRVVHGEPEDRHFCGWECMARDASDALGDDVETATVAIYIGTENAAPLAPHPG